MIPGTAHYPEGDSLTIGLPTRWYNDDPIVTCDDGHVMRLFSLADIHDPCPVCGGGLYMTYPEAIYGMAPEEHHGSGLSDPTSQLPRADAPIPE